MSTNPPPSPTPGTVVPVQSSSHFDALTKNESTLSIAFFYADFHAACQPNGQLDVVFKQLAMLHPHLRFLKIAAEDEQVADVAEKLQITAVPTFIIMQGANVLEKIEGANVATLASRVDVLSKSAQAAASTSTKANEEASKPAVDEALAYRLKKLISSSSVMLFMKGNPSEPKCGFSRQMVELLTAEGIRFSSFDILHDNDVREGLKVFSNWPTFPQLYVAGKLIGGLDIVKEMKAEGPLADQLGLRKDVEQAEDELNQSLRALVKSAPVMLFMKGTPQEPKCGFSRKMVQLLRDHQIAFSAFDILSDEQVRQGLKKLFNWPTFPQLYVRGKLIGGLDIVTEMAEDGDLSEQLGVAKKPSREEAKYEQLINRAPVMIFIKGTPQEPKCGFSRQLVELLDAEGFQYDYFDILTDEGVRQGLKKFSNWPTYPQFYVKGKLVGGLDIVQQLHEEGELADLKP